MYITLSPECTLQYSEITDTCAQSIQITVPIADNPDWSLSDIAKSFRTRNDGTLTLGESVESSGEILCGYIILEHAKTEGDNYVLEVRKGTTEECITDLYKKFHNVNFVNDASLAGVANSVIQNDHLMLQMAVNDILRG